MRKNIIKIIGVILLTITIIFIGYLESGHYDADETALQYSGAVYEDNYITYDNNSTTGFIFYPGAKVDSEAYSYLSTLSANVYIAKFPFEMAMFDYDIADQIIDDNPQVDNWYIGGRSLGGVFANRYTSENLDAINGIVYLGSYPAASDIIDIPQLALFGSQDLVVGDYTDKLELFGNDAQIIEIPNANHSGFGNYGQQKGDSELTADQIAAQQQVIINAINNFIY